MLGWLFPRCPVDTGCQVWVERRMIWLAHRFGIDRLRKAEVILPTDEQLPTSYEPNEANAQVCFDFICRRMGIDPSGVTLEIVDAERMPGAAGLYQRSENSNIIIAKEQLEQPPRLLATIAHELAHELLLKGGHLTLETRDHEYITDLLPVFLGLGIFMANATVVERNWSAGGWNFSQYSKQGYLSSVVLGYALAAFAHLRDERHPSWAHHLRTDARVCLVEGLRFLRRTKYTLLDAERHDYAPRKRSTADMREQLAHRSAVFRLDALTEIQETDSPDEDLLEPVTMLLDDHDPEVQLGAIDAIGAYGSRAGCAVQRLIQAAWYGSPAIREAAIESLGHMNNLAGEVVPALAVILADPEPKLVQFASSALSDSSGPQNLRSVRCWNPSRSGPP